MTDPALSARLVLSTAATPEEAARIGRALVEERLAACATVIAGAQSIYRWKDAVEEATETLLLLKTGTETIAALEARLHALHSYEVPEFLVFDVEAGSHRYLDWLQSCLRPPQP